MTEEKKKINWLSYIRRGIIIFIVIYGSFAPLYGPFDLGTVFFLIYIVLFIYYLVKILKAIFSKKSEGSYLSNLKRDVIWYLIIIIIICTPMRFKIQSMRIEVAKDFAVDIHKDCNLKKKCSQIKNLPWTNGRFITKKNTNNTFELSHWHMEVVHKFSGGVGKDLIFEYYSADLAAKAKIYKYLNNNWVLQK